MSARIAYQKPERIEVPERPHLSQKQRAEIHLAAKGRCQACGVKVGKGEYEIDHDEQRWLRGDDSRENLRVLCIPCHKPKSAKDSKVRAKVRGMSKLSLDQERTVSATPLRSRGFEKRERVPAKSKRRRA